MKKTLRDVDLNERKVLMRVDFNVPLSRDGDVADDTRIRATLPSIQYAADNGAAVVLMSHLGRPKGKRNRSLSLKVVAYRLAELISNPVKFVDDCVGPEVDEKIRSLAPGEVLLLENVRFYEGETANDPAFAQKLASHGDIYVNDAFGTAHRAHASTAGAPALFDIKVAGFLMEKELRVLGGLLAEVRRPFVAVLGGAKVSSKIGLIKNLLNRVDRIIIGGGMAYTFFKAAGLEIGQSLLDENFLPLCRELLEISSRGKEKQIFLPVDSVVVREVSVSSELKVVSTGDIPEDWIGVDIADKSVDIFRREILRAKTIFWNGPMGVFEIPPFASGTKQIARALVEATEKGATSVVGGGDSVAALNQLHLADKVTHLSTGGGASLELLEGKKLPGVEVLDDVNVSQPVNDKR
ncbi:MAG: phosphoglycerate kinase [Candidatus Krumholzibacteriota bacterium]|nr:phosphoglycerate kinase [Candidatus Krumholzibacteriota bacterium]